MFVALRGPNPLSGDPDVAAGSTPGMGIYQLEESGQRGVLKAVVRVTNLDAAGVERADPHGIAVRLPAMRQPRRPSLPPTIGGTM